MKYSAIQSQRIGFRQKVARIDSHLFRSGRTPSANRCQKRPILTDVLHVHAINPIVRSTRQPPRLV